MTTSDDKHLKQLLNASGFAFQLAVEDAVRAMKGAWRVSGREYPWRTERQSGYLDLVLSNGAMHAALECKRTRDATWLFLMPDEAQSNRYHAQVCWTEAEPHAKPLTGWGDIKVYPGSPEVEFCSVRGQGETDNPMLERIASSVAEAADGLALHLLRLDGQPLNYNVILPVIVTNAQLVVSSFRPGDVDLESGEVDMAKFTAVPHVRFRKSLADASVPVEYEPTTLEDLAVGSERTVFVVQSRYLTNWLSEVQMSVSDNSPWVNAREVESAMTGRVRRGTT